MGADPSTATLVSQRTSAAHSSFRCVGHDIRALGDIGPRASPPRWLAVARRPLRAPRGIAQRPRRTRLLPLDRSCPRLAQPSQQAPRQAPERGAQRQGGGRRGSGCHAAASARHACKHASHGRMQAACHAQTEPGASMWVFALCVFKPYARMRVLPGAHSCSAMLQQLHGHSQSARRHVYVGAIAVPRGAGLLVVCAAVAWEGAPGLLRRARAHFGDAGEGRRRVDAAPGLHICIGQTTQALSTWARSTPPFDLQVSSRDVALCRAGWPTQLCHGASRLSGQLCGARPVTPILAGAAGSRARRTEEMCWTIECAHPALPDCHDFADTLGHSHQCRPLLLSAGTSPAVSIRTVPYVSSVNGGWGNKV